MLKATSTASSQLYTVSEVQANLERHPEAWAGRTVWLRGIVLPAGCGAWDGTPCHDSSLYLLDRTGAALLLLAEQRLNPLLALLRRLPLVHLLMPELQVVRWGALATYRVRLLAAPAAMRDTLPCYRVLLLNAAPGAPGEG
jgi:hypothetical protein